jgi:hypothetical protein
VIASIPTARPMGRCFASRRSRGRSRPAGITGLNRFSAELQSLQSNPLIEKKRAGLSVRLFVAINARLHLSLQTRFILANSSTRIVLASTVRFFVRIKGSSTSSGKENGRLSQHRFVKPLRINTTSLMPITDTGARCSTSASVIARWFASCRGELPRRPGPQPGPSHLRVLG